MRKFFAKSFALIMTAAMLISQPEIVQAAETFDNNQVDETVISEETEIEIIYKPDGKVIKLDATEFISSKVVLSYL